MRLLPNDECSHARRAFVPVRVGHFLPPCALISLPARRLLRVWENFIVPTHAAFEQMNATPQGKMRCVPPMHLEVELPIPAVHGQPRLLRRQSARALNLRQVLRQDYASLQFMCARIRTLRKIYSATTGPEVFKALNTALF